MSDDLVLDSLRRRMRAMHSLYEDACATMNIEQVNHVEKEPCLPIAFSLFHYVNMEDGTYRVISGGGRPTWNDEWARRMGLAINDHGKAKTPEEMVAQRIGDYEVFIEYMNTVWARTEQFLTTVDPTSLTDIIVPKPYPPGVASTYSAGTPDTAGVDSTA